MSGVGDRACALVRGEGASVGPSGSGGGGDGVRASASSRSREIKISISSLSPKISTPPSAFSSALAGSGSTESLIDSRATRTSWVAETVASVYPPGLLMPGGPLPSRSGDSVNYRIGTASAPSQVVPDWVAATPSLPAALAPGTVSLPPGLQIEGKGEHANSGARILHIGPAAGASSASDGGCTTGFSAAIEPQSRESTDELATSRGPPTPAPGASSARRLLSSISRVLSDPSINVSYSPPSDAVLESSVTNNCAERAVDSGDRDRSHPGPDASADSASKIHCSPFTHDKVTSVPFSVPGVTPTVSVHAAPSASHAALISASRRLRARLVASRQRSSAAVRDRGSTDRLEQLLSVCMLGHPDSGCTGSASRPTRPASSTPSPATRSSAMRTALSPDARAWATSPSSSATPTRQRTSGARPTAAAATGARRRRRPLRCRPRRPPPPSSAGRCTRSPRWARSSTQ